MYINMGKMTVIVWLIGYQYTIQGVYKKSLQLESLLMQKALNV